MDQMAATWLASVGLVKLLSYFCHIMFQPMGNNKLVKLTLAINEHAGTDSKLLGIRDQ